MKRHGWMVTGMMMAASTVCAGAKGRLTVVLLDTVGLSQADSVVELSRRFFQSVGVESNWTVCRSIQSCSLPPTGTFVRVSLLDLRRGETLGFANMALAASGNPWVYVFHPPACDLAASTKRPLDLVIARVMVHEILHSLGLEHAPFGVMRNTVSDDELKRFGREAVMAGYQVKQLHRGVSKLQPVLLGTAP